MPKAAIFEACGNERLPRRERSTGSTGTEGAPIFFVTTRQNWFLLVNRRKPPFL